MKIKYRFVNMHYQIWIESSKKYHLVVLQAKGKIFDLFEFGSFDAAKLYVDSFRSINEF